MRGMTPLSRSLPIALGIAALAADAPTTVRITFSGGGSGSVTVFDPRDPARESSCTATCELTFPSPGSLWVVPGGRVVTSGGCDTSGHCAAFGEVPATIYDVP
ncbi:MAG: hypothetical protein JWP01_2310 [Myxococcales bacterium]|nr:hypothetical protein [Myxococcales bacterium]